MELLFTMVALRVVLAQEEGFGNECHDDPSYTELYDDLTTYLGKNPLNAGGDGEAWLRELMRHDKLHCRLAAVRLCLLYTSPSPRDQRGSRMPSSA